MLPTSSGDLAPGVAFGSYVVRELIGRGGMATVYRAEHLLLRKAVALKVMDRALLVTSGAHQRFVLEGRTVAAIKHPNVVDIADVGVYDDVPYLVMELLEGEDLDTYLRQRLPLDDGVAIGLALPVIAALQAAHASGVVHRDIKPSNIFMSIGPDEQRVPKVLDFGISKVTFEGRFHDLAATPQHHIMGTPRYLPPEALHGAGEVGPLSDQYSFAVVLYQCVTGRTPFAGDTLLALLESLSRGAFESPRSVRPSISPGLDRVITRAMSPDPGDRFPTIRDMGCALLELAGERTQMVWGPTFRTNGGGAPRWASSSPSSRGVPPSSTERIHPERVAVLRRWRPLLVGAALMLTGALAVGLWSVLSPDEPSASAAHDGSTASPEGEAERAPAVAPPETAPTREAAAPRAAGDVTAVIGLRPAPVERASPPEAEVTSARRQRAVAARSRAVAARHEERDERGRAPERTEGAGTAAAAPVVERTASAGAAEAALTGQEAASLTGQEAAAPPVEPTATAPLTAAPSEPATSPPRHGANRSPLLD